MLRLAATLHTRAARALAGSGSAREAAIAMERGRAVLLSEVLERDRADLHRLRETGYRELADRHRRAALQLSGRPAPGILTGQAGSKGTREWVAEFVNAGDWRETRLNKYPEDGHDQQSE